METVRYIGSGRYRVADTNFESGDTASVPEGLAEHLVSTVGSFERVDSAEDAATAESATSADESDAAGEEDDGGADDGEDAEATLADELAALTIDEFEAELESGRFDDRLDEVAAAERDGKDRTGIHDAIGVRRAELEG